jgi:hypothetical protein
MVFFNYATMQMAAKIVYYGPGLCGKTTNLHHIYSKTSPQSRGEMVSLETETDRTLFFDLLPIDVGVIGGFKTRLQLYTVPGQVFYNTTRKLVLKGVDGIVFVADSQPAMVEANVESFRNLRENLAEIGTDLDELPVVIQLNKRDLPNIAPIEVLMQALDPERRLDYVESVASNGTGVFETLKLISKLTLRTLRRRMTGEEPSRSSAHFRVQDNSRTMAGSSAAPHAAEVPAGPPEIATAEPERATAYEAEAPEEPMVAPPQESEAPVTEPAVEEMTAGEVIEEREPEELPVEALVEEEEPVEEAPAAMEPEAEESPAEPFAAAPVFEAPAAEAEPEIACSEAEKPQAAEPEVKTVKVRSSVDIMSELEALRKRATQTTPKAPKRDILADLARLRPKRDISRTLHLQLPADIIEKTKTVRVTLSFEDGEQVVIDTQNQNMELGDTTDVQSLSVNLKIDLA